MFWPMGNGVEKKLLLKMIVMMTVVGQSFQVNTGRISTTLTRMITQGRPQSPNDFLSVCVFFSSQCELKLTTINSMLI